LKKVGRKRLLNDEQAAELRAEMALYDRVRRECNPVALAKRFNISQSSLQNYRANQHKRDTRDMLASAITPLFA
jgi:hypothetical protein